MAKWREPFRIAIPQYHRKRHKRQPETKRIDEPGATDKQRTIDHHKPQGRILRNDPRRDLPDRRPRIHSVPLYVEPAVECHRRTPRKDHTKDDLDQPTKHKIPPQNNKTPPRSNVQWKLFQPQEKPDHRKRHRKNRMREPDQTQIILNLTHNNFYIT